MIYLRNFLMICLLLGPAAATAQETPRAGNPHGAMDLDCSLCHHEGSWDVSGELGDFDHASTGFPLEGRHAAAHCRDCHEDPRFAFVGTSCADCHADIHKGRLGVDCARCHTPQAWVQRSEQRLAHDATGFALVGAHDRVDCDACHTGPLAGDYVGTPTDCYFCHAAAYEATTDPDHAVAGFDTDCQRCHSVYASTWGGGDFSHPASFPLSGAHRALECTACHSDGFTGAIADCYACHDDDYLAADDPDHLGGDFPTTCAVCHTTTAWEPAQFDHGITGFALTGAHRGAECSACHQDGYVGTPSDCHACHQADYEGTSDPNHVASGFSTACGACHSASAWVPSTWDHDTLFPIYSGRHRGEWDSCVDCHLVPSNYAAFECIFCHEHNQADTDREHLGEVSNYQYNSAACFACHPRGEED
jgi:hypothetical protein